MNEHDFLNALGKVPQEMLDELAQWQQSGTPLTEHLPELDSADPAPVAVTQPEIRQRRNSSMKQAQKQNTKPVRLLPWTIGIGAAMAACLVAAVSVGREAIGRQDSMQTGFTESSPLSQINEQEPLEEIAIDHTGKFSGAEIPVPEDGLFQVIRNMDDAAPLIEALSVNDANGNAYTMYSDLNEDWLTEHDVVLIGNARSNLPTMMWDYAYHDGTVTPDGNMTVDISVLSMPHQWDNKDQMEYDYNCYYHFSVPKGTLPEITGCEVTWSVYSLGEKPEDVLVDLFNEDGTPAEYLTSNPIYQEYVASTEGQRYLRKLPAKKEIPEDCVEIVEAAPLPEPVGALIWTRYHGDDLSIPEDGIVTVIRTAEEASYYLTDSGQQNEDIDMFLSKEWLEDDSTDAGAHDILFIGLPGKKLPHNTRTWDYHAGTITPSGKLHLDFSVFSLTSMPEQLTYDADTTNFYYFISIPKGELPEITQWDVTFTEFRSDEMPDGWTLEDLDRILSTGETKIEAWMHDLPEFDSHFCSVLCDKYIDWVYDDVPNTVEPLRSLTVGLDIPVSRSYGNVIEDADGGHTEAYLDYVFDTESNVYAGVADTLESYRALRDALNLENLELIVDRNEQVDVLLIVLPVHDRSARTAITDLKISADGVLSVTLNEYYESDQIDFSQDTASVVWQIMVPHGTLPDIMAVGLHREYFGPTMDEELAFIGAAGRMHTIQLTDEKLHPASAVNTRQPEDEITDDSIEEIAPTE